MSQTNSSKIQSQIGANHLPTHRHARKFPKFEVSRDYASFAQGTSQFTDESFEDALAAEAASQQAAAQNQTPTVQEAADAILTCIGSQGELREILYKTLVFCRETRSFSAAEQYIAQLDEITYGHVIQTPYSCISMLVHVGGLEKIPVDDRGNCIEAQRLENLDADEADDLIDSWCLKTTRSGLYVCELLDPARRLTAQLALKPYRRATYLRILEFCAQQPRSLDDIKQLFKEDKTLVLDYVTAHQKLSPDYYVDRLEKAGGLIWKGAWITTPAGWDCVCHKTGA